MVINSPIKVEVTDHQVLHTLTDDEDIEKIDYEVIKIENIEDYKQLDENYLSIEVGKKYTRKYKFPGKIIEY